MSSRNLARPIFPLPPEQYSREYMDRLVQSFAVYLEQYQNPGEGRSTKTVMTAVPTTPSGLEDGTVWVDSTILRIGAGGTPGTFVIPNLEVTGLLEASGTLDITGVFKIAGTTVTSSAVELNYNDITTLGTVQENKTVTAGTGKAIDFANAPMANVDINSGAIDGTTIGAVVPAALTATTGNFTAGLTSTTGEFTSDLTIADRIIHKDDIDTQIRFSGLNDVSVETNGQQRMLFEGTTGVVFNEPGNNYDFRIESDTNTHMFFVDASTDRVGVGTSTPQAAFDARGGAVFNEDGADADFRVESDLNTHMLFVDASTNRIGINTDTPTTMLDVRGAAVFNEGGDANADFRVESDTNTHMFFVRSATDRIGINTSDPQATLDVRGSAVFNEGASDFDFRIESVANTHMFFVDGFDNRVGINVSTPQATLDVQGSAIFNDAGADVDFRIESDTNDHMFFVDASTDRVGIGRSTPSDTLDVNGGVVLTGAGGLGYGTGSGGAVTQATSRTTGVTLNKTNGAITLVSDTGTTSWQTFTVTNSTVAATDTVIINQQSGTDQYMIHVTAVAAGSFNVTFATTGGATVEQPVFNFAVIRAVTS